MEQQNKAPKAVYWFVTVFLAIIVISAVFKSGQRNGNRYLDQIKSTRDVQQLLDPRQFIHTHWYGEKAPDFLIEDVNGKKHQLSEYEGKDVLLIFWATWCPPCRAEIPDLKEIRDERSEKDFVLIGISFENPKIVKRFAEKNELNYPVCAIKPSELPAPYSMVSGFPSAVFINKPGNVKLATVGGMDGRILRKLIDLE